MTLPTAPLGNVYCQGQGQKRVAGSADVARGGALSGKEDSHSSAAALASAAASA
jgi:hypothetical protein